MMTINKKFHLSKESISFFLFFLFICTLSWTLNPFQAVASESIKILADGTSDENIATFDEEASFDSDSSTTTPELGKSVSNLLHADHYHSPDFFPNRIKRSVDGHPWIRLLPFTVLVMLAITTIRFSAKRKQKPVMAKSRVGLKKVSSVSSGIILIVLVSVGISNALTYSSVKDAVVDFMGEGQKIYQTSIEITPDIKQTLKKELEWNPQKDSIKVYYNKTDDGTVDSYAFVLSEKLKLCGGLHKYCVKISAKGEVEGVKILELTCDRSYCINTKAFLNQFKAFNSVNANQKKYDTISGATLSTNLTQNIVRRALYLYNILKESTNA
ncbi:MAG: FMN-binding protein [Desulfobacteraceae bacterium]|jgi:hypothetical protein